MVHDDERDIRPMPTNPGGVVDPADLIGRQSELTQLYQAVNVGGAKVLGDRRMGKTSMLRVAEAELREVGHTVVRVSAETSDAHTFARYLMTQMRGEKLIKDALGGWTTQLGGEVGINLGVASIKLTCAAKPGEQPRELDPFRSCAEAARRSGPYRVVFIFDEITALARGLAGNDRAQADELFRTLRVPRQEIDNVSIVMAGSIGLHHVLSDMAVVNDIPPVDVGPLAEADAVFLARCLLRGADVATTDEAEVAAAIVISCAAVPFYIHKLVARFEASGASEVDPDSIDDLVTRILEDPTDEWEMRHYDTRLPDYYGADAPLVRKMLDAYALAGAGLTVEQLSAGLAAVPLDPRPDRDKLLGLLPRLEADHYLVRDGSVDRMATPLLRRAWRAIRRLG